MKITRISSKQLIIPFKQVFSHSSATRKTTEAVVIEAESQNGFIGYGEGCPRQYVTGENVNSALKFIDFFEDIALSCSSLDSLKTWVIEHKEVIDTNPAAYCAIELACLDLLGKESGQSVEQTLSLPALSGVYQYTAVLGVSSIAAYEKQLRQYVETGFMDYKIKISGDLDNDKQKIMALKAIPGNIRVRLDANNLWQDSNTVTQYVSSLDYPFFAIEEPLAAGDFDGCRKVSTALNIPIILDESFMKHDQFEHLLSHTNKWIINLRVSKMGGILRSLSIAETAKKLKIPIIIGAQVGETSILTRAALTIANTYRDILLAQEGAFGTHLLKHDITDKPLMFGANGVLNFGASREAGLGIIK